jgi:hypothetical protein
MRIRREMIGYPLLIGGTLLLALDYGLAIVLVLIGYVLWASRAFRELFLFVKVHRMGYEGDEELVDRIDAELTGEDPDFYFAELAREEAEGITWRDKIKEEYKIPEIKDLLRDDEEVTWGARGRASFNYALHFVATVFILIFIFASPLPVDSPLSILGLLYCIIAYAWMIGDVFLFRKWYFITSLRILEVRRKRVVKEIELSRFSNRPLQEVIGMRLDHYSDEMATAPVYDIIIYDPDTSEPLTKFNDIMHGDLWNMETKYFQIMRECKSCGMKSSSKIETCHGCGQPLSKKDG